MPSMVVMARSPIDPTGRRHERTGLPSTCTVQAPHWAMPQPYFVPVMPSTSRNTQSSGVSPPTSTSCLAPLTLIEKVMTFCLHGKSKPTLLPSRDVPPIRLAGVGRVFDDFSHRIGVRD